MRFCKRSEVTEMLAGKVVALVGSGPGALHNAPGKIDGCDVVVRVNNYKLTQGTGARTDIFYSFFGQSIRKTPAELKADGVKLCYCKCPDAKFIESEWHVRHRKLNGVDFRYIYRQRAGWWFGPVYIPSIEEFMAHFELLGHHVPTTGFGALLDLLSHHPSQIFMTGFDFFQSGIHNVNERWRAGDPSDPIGHDPRAERRWLLENLTKLPIECDDALVRSLQGEWVPPPQPQRKSRIRPRFTRRRRVNGKLVIT